MTQHTDLIERLRSAAWAGPVPCPVCDEAADALEATAKNAFEAMPHDIPRRMKRRICVDADWSGSLASRAYIEIRKAFTGEPYKANEDLDAALLEIEALKAQESELCTLYGMAQAECKKLRKDAALVAARERERIDVLCAALKPFADFEAVRSTMGASSPKSGLLWAVHSRAGSAEISVEDMQAAIRALNTEGYGNDRP